MNKKPFLLMSLLLTLVWGCTMAPTYKRPAAPIPPEWPGIVNSERTVTNTESNVSHEFSTLKWQDFFTDERLQRLIETALTNNRDFRLAALNMERARAMYGIQRAELLPPVNAVGSGSKEHVPADLSSTGTEMTTERYAVTLGISSWEIDFFGRIRSLKNQALEEYLATEEARRSAEISLVSGVAQAYMAFAADHEALKVARSTLETQQAAFDLIEKSFMTGVVTELDLRRSQIQLESARRDVAGYAQRVTMDENALTLLLGSSAPKDLLADDLNGFTFPIEVFTDVSSEALLLRPDILLVEHRLKGTYANIGAARAAFFPRIALTTAIGTASSELTDLFKSGQDTWSFTPQIILPIFDARTWPALKVSKVDREIAVTQYEKAIQNAFRETADALAIRDTVDQQVEAQQSLVNAAAETYRLADARYNKGIDSYLNVLDAQRTLYSAQQGLIALRLARFSNQVVLYRVMGGLIEK